MTQSKIKKLINCPLSTLIGKNVTGIMAQVTNPKYLSKEAGVYEKYRVLRKIETFKERGKMWVQIYWVRDASDSCDFTGCTLESDSCMIQIAPDDLIKLNKQS